MNELFRAPLKHLLRALALLGTTLALVATTCSPPCKRTGSELATFDVIDSGCGATGEFSLYATPTCDVYASGTDALGLPAAGNFYTDDPLADGGWELDDLSGNDGRHCEALRVQTLPEGALELRCLLDDTRYIESGTRRCTAIVRAR